MERQDYGCSSDNSPNLARTDGDDNNDNDDENSVVSETQWKEAYRGDSRRWLMRDGSIWRKSDERKVSTMRASFAPNSVMTDEKKLMGIRKASLLQKLFDEAAEEIIREREEPPTVEEYCTEYDGNFSVSGYNTGKEYHEDEELYEKYPLYTSPPMTFWNFEIEQKQRSRANICGLTKSTDLKNPFKKNSNFTKPIAEVLDFTQL